MKKTIVVLAVMMLLGALKTPTLKADGMPDPSCKSGECKPFQPGGGH